MIKMKPQIRDLRVVINSLGTDKKIQRHYNDKRVNGGRIKAYFDSEVTSIIHTLGLIENRLDLLFPGNVFKVEQYNDRAITVKWEDKDVTFSR